MVEIGSKPMLWHIMQLYSAHGLNDFIVCCGYKGYIIKEYFSNYLLHSSDVTFDMKTNTTEIHHKEIEPWRVTLVETGETTQTGGRIKRIARYLDDEDFAMTYGDAVGEIDITALMKFHKEQGKKATVAAVRPPARFGALETEGTLVTRFKEKPAGGDAWINGGFFVLSPSVLDYIEGDATLWEQEPLELLAQERQLAAYYHHGFWQAMDTLRDRNYLEELWSTGRAPWKTP
jgi:glucose-1-phosphate cytidylyltransferase